MTEVPEEIYLQAVENVYQGRQPEFQCKEHGHFDCAFTEGGHCSGEAISKEIGRMIPDQPHKWEPRATAPSADGRILAQWEQKPIEKRPCTLCSRPKNHPIHQR